MNHNRGDLFMGFTSTWADFETSIKEHKVILYGLGTLLNYLFIRCNADIPIIAAIDNDVTKQGHTLSEFFDEVDLKEAKNIIVSPKFILKSFNPNDTVILISTLRHFEAIAKDLETMNYHRYFSILHLEYNYNEHMKSQGIKTEDNYVLKYAKKCADEFPIQNNKIIFGGMDRYPDHGKYITDQLKSMNKNLDIVWISNTPSIDVPEGVRVIYEGKWKQYIYELETAKVWVYDMQIRTQPIKRPGQTYIQVKHWGSITLKRFYLNEEIKTYEEEVWNANGKMMDYIISGSEFDEETCRRGFNFHGQFLRFGSPRSDPLFNPDYYKKKIYKKFGLNNYDRILMYAPTFRANSNQKSPQYEELDFDTIIEALNQKWAGNWKIFLRYHPSVKVNRKDNQSNFVIDVSKYEYSQELVAASDVMISDYSSIMFEPAYILRPVFLYAPDKENYIKNEREFLIDYNSLPFPISMTNESLSEQIKNFNEVDYKIKVQKFLDKYGVHEDGHASERTAKFIMEILH